MYKIHCIISKTLSFQLLILYFNEKIAKFNLTFNIIVLITLIAKSFVCV